MVPQAENDLLKIPVTFTLNPMYFSTPELWLLTTRQAET